MRSPQKFDRGGPYEAEEPQRRGQLSQIEKLLAYAGKLNPMRPSSAITRPLAKTALGMLGTYDPESDQIKAGLRPGLIDDIIGLPSDVDDIMSLIGRETHLSGPLSKTASALASASKRRRDLVSPPRDVVDRSVQGASDAMFAVPGSTPAKLSKLASAVTAAPRLIYDTVIPVMDLSTKTGKGVAAASGVLGAGLGAIDDSTPGGQDFFDDLYAKINPDESARNSKMIDDLIAKATAGDRAAYEKLKVMFPSEVR